MKIILNEDVYNLGEEGDVCDVKRGYARNYLFPRQLAYPFTKAHISAIEQRRAAIEKRKEEKRKDALSLKERIEETTLDLQVPAGDSGRLFGSVTNSNIAEGLEKEGISIERKKIEVPEHNIKQAGTYSVRIKLYANETADLTVKVNQHEAPAEKNAENAESTEVSEENESPEIDENIESSVDTIKETEQFEDRDISEEDDEQTEVDDSQDKE